DLDNTMVWRRAVIGSCGDARRVHRDLTVYSQRVLGYSTKRRDRHKTAGPLTLRTDGVRFVSSGGFVDDGQAGPLHDDDVGDQRGDRVGREREEQRPGVVEVPPPQRDA